MPAAWPAELQDLLNEESFGFDFGDTTISSEVSFGPVKKRRRWTRPIDVITCSIDITTETFEDLYYFYNTTLNGGVTTFLYNHPITGVETEFRMMSPPKISSKGGGNFVAQMQWEIIP